MTHFPKRCLVLIDLQNDFLAPEGPFRVHAGSLPFLANLPDIVTAFRVSGYPIFWIRSKYAVQADASDSTDRQQPTPILAGTHTGSTPCCVEGTAGVKFPPDVQTLINDSSIGEVDNVVLTKKWYSGFKETLFHDELRRREITELFVGGLLTNICVNATVNDVLALGFNVTLLEDCLGWRKHTSHDRALRAMQRLGARLSSAKSAQMGLIFPDSTPQLEISYLSYST